MAYGKFSGIVLIQIYLPHHKKKHSLFSKNFNQYLKNVLLGKIKKILNQTNKINPIIVGFPLYDLQFYGVKIIYHKNITLFFLQQHGLINFFWLLF